MIFTAGRWSWGGYNNSNFWCIVEIRHPNMVFIGIRVLSGFDSGEGAWEIAATSKEGRNPHRHPISHPKRWSVECLLWVVWRKINNWWGKSGQEEPRKWQEFLYPGYKPDRGKSGIYNKDGLAQDCNNSSALAMELLQSCTKPSI